MDAKNIAIMAYQCTPAADEVVALWSAFHLPLCRTWVAKHGLQPPDEVMEILQKKRFDLPLSYETIPMHFMVITPEDRQNQSNKESVNELNNLCLDLALDLQHFQMRMSFADSSEQKSEMASRDLQRSLIALAYLKLSHINIVACTLSIVPLFSRQNTILYIPSWLISVLPRTLFVPNQSFHRPRPSSLIWLLLDAIVLDDARSFKTVQEHYGMHSM